MKRETPEQKWNRIQSQIHGGIMKGYSNPDRKDCPGRESIVALAIRSADFDDTVEDDPQWQHLTHCSPCYHEYLEEFRNQRARKKSGQTE